MSGKCTSGRFISDIATGTSPYSCTSTTLNTNLNADLWDGYNFSDYIDQALKKSDNVQFASVTLPDSATAYTYYDMLKGAVTCKYRDSGTAGDHSAAPDTYWAAAGDFNVQRSAMATQDAIYATLLGESGGVSVVWRIQLPEDYPVANYDAFLYATVDWWMTDNGYNMKDCTFYIYNNNTPAWESLGTSAGDEGMPTNVTATITSNISYYIDANKRVHIKLQASVLEAGDFYWNLDYAGIGLKLKQSKIYSTGGTGIWEGNLLIAGDLEYQGSQISSDIRPRDDNAWTIGSDTWRYAQITSSIFNVYTRLNIGSSVYGNAQTSHPPINIYLSNETAYNSTYLEKRYFEEWNPNSIGGGETLYTNYELITDRVSWGNTDPAWHIFRLQETYRDWRSVTGAYALDWYINEWKYSWASEGDQTHPETGRWSITMLRLSNSFSTTGSEDMPAYWNGIYFLGGTPAWSDVLQTGFISALDCGFYSGTKLYFDTSGTYPQIAVGDTYLSYVTANSDLELYVDNTLVMVWDDDLIEPKINMRFPIDIELEFNAATESVSSQDAGYLDLKAATGVRTNNYLRHTSANYRRYYHLPLFASNPGATGATFVAPSANSTGGYRLDAATEFLYSEADVHSDWDAASDLKVEVFFQVNVDNTGGLVGDTVDLKLQGFFMGTGDTACKTPTIAEVATVVGQSAQYKLFKATFTIDYDTGGNVVEVGDKVGFILNIETDTSEVDDIIVTNASFYYNTTHLGVESGDV